MASVKRGVIARARHKKILKRPKATTVRVARYSALPSRPSSRPANMPIATVVRRSVSSALCGSRVSMHGT